MKEIMRFDFGNSTVRADDGFLKMERLYTSCHFMWMTELKNRWRRETEVSPFRDFVFAEKSERESIRTTSAFLLCFLSYSVASPNNSVIFII